MLFAFNKMPIAPTFVIFNKKFILNYNNLFKAQLYGKECDDRKGFDSLQFNENKSRKILKGD